MFMASTTWHADNIHEKKTLYVGDGSRALTCSVIGIVSPDGLQMENNGDYEPDSTSRDFGEAHFRLKLNALEGDNDNRPIRSGFRQTVWRSKQLVGVLSDKEVTLKPFIEERDGVVTLSFSRRIFELKVCTLYIAVTVKALRGALLPGSAHNEVSHRPNTSLPLPCKEPRPAHGPVS